ncbi:MAG TPA: nitrilase-related carbon-nitrogen hydrolase, partial [Polyangia bacterium]|nr:nitrilase-related carbon-nitrogen hydrolase [Polyangia bacterium]
MTARIRLGLSVLSGVLLFLAVPGFGLWPLMFVAMVPQLWVARAAATPRRAFLYGWLTGTIANAGGFYWMDGLLEKFGHMPAVEALPIMLLLVAYQGLEFALFSWLVRRAVDRTHRPLALLAPLAMVAIELLVPQIFPYYLAIAVAFVPRLIQVADLTGPLGVTALLLAFNGAAADLLAQRRWRGLAVAAALLVVDLGYGTVRLHQADARRATAPKVRTGLVQANVGILEKWDPAEFARLLRLHQDASADLARAGAQLIVWPESSYPYALPRDFAHDFPPEDARRIRRGFDTPLLFGALTIAARSARRGPDKYPYNTALMMNAAGGVDVRADPGVHRPHHLQPVLDGAEDRQRQVLVRLGGPAEPGVVGDVDEGVRLETRHPARPARQDVLVADERAQLEVARRGVQREGRRLGAAAEVRRLREDLREPGDLVVKRHVLAEHHQEHLVVAGGRVAGG